MNKLSVLDRWNNFKRLLLVVFAVLMWVMSIVFSYLGFKSGVRNEWYFGLFALILSGAITTMELYLNSQTFDFSELEVGMIILWIGGLAAYAYGIWTNVIGMSIMMVNPDTSNWQAWVVPVIGGVLLEILPEPMFVAFLKTKKVSPLIPQGQNQAPKRTIPIPETLRQRYPSDVSHR